MDEAQIAMNSLDKFIVAKHRYDTEAKEEGCMICFFEGLHDKDYYKPHIRTICGDIIDIPCHSKANVLKMYNLIHQSEKDKYRLAYFIDKDFDEIINNPDIFETEGYSIENYYCSKEAFGRIMTDYLYLDSASDDYIRAMSFYEREFENAHNIVAEFNHYYSAIKRLERSGGPQYSIEAGDSFPKQLGKIEINNYLKNYSLESLNQTYGTSISEDDINTEKVLIDANPCLYYRGKYEIQELENIIVYIIKEAKGERNVERENRVLHKNPNVACFQSGKLLLALSAMADVTQQLRDYLKKFAL